VFTLLTHDLGCHSNPLPSAHPLPHWLATYPPVFLWVRVNVRTCSIAEPRPWQTERCPGGRGPWPACWVEAAVGQQLGPVEGDPAHPAQIRCAGPGGHADAGDEAAGGPGGTAPNSHAALGEGDGFQRRWLITMAVVRTAITVWLFLNVSFSSALPVIQTRPNAVPVIRR
jgi:hypothetical protein